MQLGWATDGFKANTANGEGCGDDASSWAYDGYRLKKWHAGSEVYSTTKWKEKDVVGCGIDLDVPGGEIRFFLNGRDLGVAYAGDLPVQKVFYPAMSLSQNESTQFIFDPAKMKGT